MEEKIYEKLKLRIQYSWYHEFINILEGIPIYGVYTVKLRGSYQQPHYMIEFRFMEKITGEDFEKIREVIMERLLDKNIIVDDVTHLDLEIIGRTIETELKVDAEKLLKK